MSWTEVMPIASRFSLVKTEIAIGIVCTSWERFSAVTTTTSMSAKAGAVKAVERNNAPTSVTDLAVQADECAIWYSPVSDALADESERQVPRSFVRPELVGQIDAVNLTQMFRGSTSFGPVALSEVTLNSPPVGETTSDVGIRDLKPSRWQVF